MIVLGFTGTRNGMTDAQRAEVTRQLKRIQPDEVVHGDCVGADDDFDWICEQLGIPGDHRHIRPCTFENMRARCDERRGAKVVAEPKPPMQRNRDIVADADVILATPPNDVPIRRGSGTWATIKFGQRKGIEVVVVAPDGTVVSP